MKERWTKNKRERARGQVWDMGPPQGADKTDRTGGPFSLISTQWRASVRRGSPRGWRGGLRSPEALHPSILPTWTGQYARFMLHLSAAPTRHSAGMSYWWTDQSGDGAACVLKRAWVCL